MEAEFSVSAMARITVRLIAMKIAAGTPLPDTSAMTKPKRSWSMWKFF